MRWAGIATILLVVACSSGGAVPEPRSAAAPSARTTVDASASPAKIPPPGSNALGGGCGATEVYQRGLLPDWANVNAPKFLPYVVAAPGLAVGYLLNYPLRATP